MGTRGRNTARRVRPGCHSIDHFGMPMQLNFKGHTHFKSVPGAIVTLIVYGLVLYYAIIGVLDILTFGKIEHQSHVRYDLKSTIEQNMFKNKQDIAVGFFNHKELTYVDLDPRVGYVSVQIFHEKAIESRF